MDDDNLRAGVLLVSFLLTVLSFTIIFATIFACR